MPEEKPEKIQDLDVRLHLILRVILTHILNIRFIIVGLSTVALILEGQYYLTGTINDAPFFDILQKLVTSIGLFIGGLWVLWNYDRNRTHVERLQVEVKAEIIKRENRRYLLVTYQAKNIGLSNIELREQEEGDIGLAGTELLVRRFYRVARRPDIHEVLWELEEEEPSSFAIFTNHKTIEPGLTISEQKLIYVPQEPYLPNWWYWSYDAYEIRLRVSTAPDSDQQWTAITVAVLGSDLNEPVA